MSHQAARVLLRTEPEQQASVTARFQSTRQPLARRFFRLPHSLTSRMHTSAAFSFSRCPALCRLRKCGTFYAHSAPLIVQTILRPATLPRTRKFLYDAIQASGEVAVQHAAKLAENIFRPTPHGATLPRVKKRPSQVGVTGVQPEKKKSTNQLTPCVSDDPTSSEEHWCDMDESNPEPNLDGPHE
ncbi:hypothetical protein BASA83_001251 [Batrachochytrium salamandrivorans]|nr:hypothetical protein BASA83_001251 [Batrachochytrium salamandrivorans]